VLHNPRGRVIQAGMQDYISKPFQPDQLNQKLAQFLTPGQPATAGRSAKASNGYIQMDYLESISPGNKAFQLEMITLFESQSKEFVHQARAAFLREDIPTLQRLAHAFKPQGSYVGINSLSAIIAKIEEAAVAHGDGETIAALLAQAQIIIDHAQAEIEIFKKKFKQHVI
jgi:HPt (histidine-containing phosphotransfer) domain-containing protein